MSIMLDLRVFLSQQIQSLISKKQQGLETLGLTQQDLTKKTMEGTQEELPVPFMQDVASLDTYIRVMNFVNHYPMKTNSSMTDTEALDTGVRLFFEKLSERNSSDPIAWNSLDADTCHRLLGESSMVADIPKVVQLLIFLWYKVEFGNDNEVGPQAA